MVTSAQSGTVTRLFIRESRHQEELPEAEGHENEAFSFLSLLWVSPGEVNLCQSVECSEAALFWFSLDVFWRILVPRLLWKMAPGNCTERDGTRDGSPESVFQSSSLCSSRP